MTLVKRIQPGRPFGNLIEDWFQEFPGLLREAGNLAGTPVNIVENKDGYHLEVNAPGRNKEDFKVQVDKGLLTISYEHKEESTSEDLKVIRREFSAASFKRSFSVDEKADAATHAAAKQKAEEDKIAKQRADNCTRARNAQATFESGTPIRQTNAQGERVFLDDAARAAELRRIQDIINADCKR